MINVEINKSFFDILSPPFYKKEAITQLLNVPCSIMANKYSLIKYNSKNEG